MIDSNRWQQNLLNLKMQLTSIEFQFNSLFTQMQNMGFISNISIQINTISFQILNFGIQMLNLGIQVNDNMMMNNISSKDQINFIINQLKNILMNISNDNGNQEIDLINKKENNNLKNEINELKKEIKILKEQNNKVKNKFEDSKIINANEYDMISDWISPNKKIELNLLYRASRDGDKAKIFHDKCDNKGSSFCIFHLDNGYKIGAYSSISWKNNGGKANDPNTFICSITNKEKYELKNKNGYSVYNDSSYGPDFYGGIGYADVIIYDNCLNRKDGILVNSNAYNSSMIQLIGKMSDSYLFLKLKDYEVYQIL